MFDEMAPFLKDEINNINKVGCTCNRTHIREMIFIFLMRNGSEKLASDHTILDSIIEDFIKKGYISCDMNGNFL
jgi:hypothetical protein